MNYGKEQLKKKLTETGSEERRQKNRFFMFLVMLFVAVFVGGTVCLMAAGIGAFTEILRNVPEVESVDMIEPDENKSIIYAADGSVMQELVQSGSNRINVPYEKFPAHLVDAFIAIEDSRFFTHDGVDVKGIIRAVFVGLTSGSLSEGASTITQQLIKNNVFDGGFEKNLGDRFERKLQEQYLALRVEQSLSKKQIIEYYLNTINLGSNCLGVQVASKRYFNKDVSELNLAECTVLAATTSSPSRYDPIKHPDNNQRRRKIVLQYMLNNGAITAEEYDSAIGEEVYSRVQAVAANYTGIQTFSYFTDTVFEDVLSHLETDLGYSEAKALSLMYSGGLRIYTTEDPAMQKIAEEEANRASNYYYIDETGVIRERASYKLGYTLAIKLDNGAEFFYNENNLAEYFKTDQHRTDFSLIFPSEEALRSAVDEYRDHILEETGGKIMNEIVNATIEPQTSVVLIDQATGYVKAVVGGRGDKKEMGSLVLNRATQSTRQPGSTFKIVSNYAPAIDQKGKTLASTYYDAKLLVNGREVNDWWGPVYTGYTNIRAAIQVSSNIVAIRCLEETVSENLGIEYAKLFGITTLDERLDKSPNLTLGGLTRGVSNLEMTAAYATVANGGVYMQPIFWTHVTDLSGNVILENKQVSRAVLKTDTAKLLTSAMQSTIEPEFTVFPREGVSATNVGVRVKNVALAAKSGTTNEANDLWLIGYSPAYTLGVWCGNDDSEAIGFGADYHRNVWAKIMARIHSEVPLKTNVRSFDYSGLVKVKICSKSGLLAKEGVCDACGDENCHVYEEYFTASTVPTETCNRHVQYHICKESGLPAGRYCPEDEVEDRVYILIDTRHQLMGETDDDEFLLPTEVVTSTCDYHTEEWAETHMEAYTEFDPFLMP